MSEKSVEVLATLEELWEKRLESAKRKAQKIIDQAYEDAKQEHQEILKQAEEEAQEKRRSAAKLAAKQIEELEQDTELRKLWLEQVDIDALSKEIFPSIVKNMV